MITISKLEKNSLFIHLSDTVNHHDYEHTLMPAIADIIPQYKTLNIAVTFDDDFKGIALNALLDDAQVGLKYWQNWHKIAFVASPHWLQKMAGALELIAPFTIDYFDKELAAQLWFDEEDYF